MSKDYYKILGVQEDADELVIRASYLALLKRYNLDDWKGDDKQRAIKMLADINEAYSVLKDRHERLEYNSTRQKEQQQADATKPIESTLTPEEAESAWKVACSYYDDLEVLYFNLFQISEQVANNFKFAILSTKDYQNRNKLAAKLELDYLRSQFGNDQDLIGFGKELILEEDAKDAVAELNHVVAVMGNAVHAEDVIHKISKKYQTQRYLNEIRRIEDLRIYRLREEEESQRRKILILNQQKQAEKQYRRDFWVFVLVLIILAVGVIFSLYALDLKKISSNGISQVNQTKTLVENIREANYYQRVSLVGLLSERQGIDCCTDGEEKKINYPVLVLSSPINVVSKSPLNPPSDEPPELSVKDMQLVMSPRIFDDFLANKFSRVTVECSLFHSINGHHMTPVLCDVQQIRAAR